MVHAGKTIITISDISLTLTSLLLLFSASLGRWIILLILFVFCARFRTCLRRLIIQLTLLLLFLFFFLFLWFIFDLLSICIFAELSLNDIVKILLLIRLVLVLLLFLLLFLFLFLSILVKNERIKILVTSSIDLLVYHLRARPRVPPPFRLPASIYLLGSNLPL
jgi:hypothetical protein